MNDQRSDIVRLTATAQALAAIETPTDVVAEDQTRGKIAAPGGESNMKANARDAGNGPATSDRKDSLMKLEPMSRRDASDLAAHVRREAHNAKAMANVRTAEVLADFEKQLATQYSFDQDRVWKKAAEEAEAVVQEANEKIAQRCRELGIPLRFAPRLGGVGWYSRGENMVKQRRIELRKVAETRLAAMEKAAKVQIETSSLEMQKVLLSGVVASSEAQAFLARMPTASDLMPVLALGEIAKELGPGRNYYGVGPDDEATP